MKLLIIGPFEGYHAYNLPAYSMASASLARLGHTVYSLYTPADVQSLKISATPFGGINTTPVAEPLYPGADEHYVATVNSTDLKLRIDQIITTGIDALVLLPGTEHSRSANEYWAHAHAHQITAYTFDQALLLTP